MCILLINSYKLSETRSSVLDIVYVLTTLVGSFFRELGFHTSSHLCIGSNFPMYIDKVLYFHVLVLLEYLVSGERRQSKPLLGGMRAAALSI